MNDDELMSHVVAAPPSRNDLKRSRIASLRERVRVNKRLRALGELSRAPSHKQVASHDDIPLSHRRKELLQHVPLKDDSKEEDDESLLQSVFPGKNIAINNIVALEPADWEKRLGGDPGEDPYVAYKSDLMRQGKYAVSFNFRFVYWKKNKAGASIPYEKSAVDVQDYTVKTKESVASIVEEIIEWYRNSAIYLNYDFKVLEVWKVRLDLYTEKELKMVYMKGSALHYKFLEEVMSINEDQGQCVFDYILSEINDNRIEGKKYIAQITRAQLVEYFGRDSEKNGVTTKQVMDWVKSKRYVSCYALDPFLEKFSEQRTESGDATRHTLVFICNNGHCYPVTNPVYKDQVTRKGRIELDVCKFDVKFEDYQYVAAEDIEMEMESLSLGEMKKKIVLLEKDNLSEVIANVALKTQFLTHNMSFSGNRVVCFEHPVTKTIYISAEDHDQRVETCKILHNEFPCTEFIFKNQSFSRLASSYFDIRYGNIERQSECSPVVMAIFENYRIKPYTTQFTHELNALQMSQLQSFDVSRCYTSVLINNSDYYNVFSPFDGPVKFDDNLNFVPGEYYVNKDFFFGGGTIKIALGWYPWVLIKYAIENGHINRNDITYYIKASYLLAAGTFKMFAEDTIGLFNDSSRDPNANKLEGSATAKSMVNHFIGGLNLQYTTSTKGCITQDFDCAMGVVFSEKEKGREAKIHQVNDFFFVRSEFKVRKQQTSVPIYRHILASAFIELDKLHKAVCTEDSVVVAYNTDCIKLYNPRYVESIITKKSKDLVPGDIRLEDEVGLIKGTLFEKLEPNDPFVYETPQWNYQDETNDNYDDIAAFVKDNSCLVSGMGGCGKTELIKRTWTPGSVALTFTNKATDNLKQRGVDSHTLKSYFSEKASFDDHVNRLSNLDCVVIDEYSMVPPGDLALLYNIKVHLTSAGKKCPMFKLFGDTDQCVPIADRIYDYDNSDMVKELCGLNHIRLLYKIGERSRYNKELYDFIIAFKRDKVLPVVPDMKLGDYYTNITVTNEKKDEVNKKCLARFITENPLAEGKMIGDVLWVTGMPVIAEDNIKQGDKRSSIPVFNSQMFTFVRFSATKMYISRPGYDGVPVEIEVRVDAFNDIFSPGFAVTVYRYQGGTINEHFNIHEIEHGQMRYNELYTALSRGTRLEYVHFSPNEKLYKKVKPTIKSSILTQTPKKMMKGLIYRITDPDQSFIYIGSTTTSLVQRFEQHKKKPTSKRMAQVINNEGVTIELLDQITCTDIEAVLRLEDFYIAAADSNPDIEPILLNVKRPPRIHTPVKITIIQPTTLVKEKFEPFHNVEGKFYQISATVPTDPFSQSKTKRIQRKFSYKTVSQELQKAAAYAECNLLRQRYIGQSFR